MAQLLNQRYQFIQSLGSNSLGQTALVGDTQQTGHPRCVLKQLRLPSGNPKSLELSLLLLKKKADTLKTVGNHPQIPQILDYFYEGQSFYLVEEYVPGRSLATFLASGQRFSEPQARQFLHDVLQILAFIHPKGIIHRCLKPDSILYRHVDRSLVLVGFGIFKEISTQILRQQGQAVPPLSNEVMAYIPPEQAMGKSQPSSDLYALGVLAIQALTGQCPQEIVRITETLDTNSWEEQVSISEGLLQVLKIMVEPSHHQRYRSATEVLAALTQVLQTQAQNGKLRNGQSAYETIILPLEPEPSELEEVQPSAPIEESAPSTATVPEVNDSQPLKPETQEDVVAPVRRSRPLSQLPTPLLAALLGLGIVLPILGLGLFFRVPQKLLSGYWLNQGETHQEQADWSAALAAYDRALQWQPEQSTAYYERGQVYQQLDDRQAALEDFTAAIQRGSEPESAYYQRANVRFSLGDYEGALADYTAALEMNPENAKAYINRGNTQAALGNDPQALEDYNQAIALKENTDDLTDETLAVAYVNRCLSRSNLDDHQGALEDCNRAINLRPTHGLAYQNRGLVRRRVEDFQGAIADYNIAIELDDQDPEPLYNRGLARQDLGAFPGAIVDFSLTLELDPEHLLVYYDRGQAYLALGDVERAKQDFQEAAQRCLDSSRLSCYEDAQYALGQLAEPEEPVDPSSPE